MGRPCIYVPSFVFTLYSKLWGIIVRLIADPPPPPPSPPLTSTPTPATPLLTEMPDPLSNADQTEDENEAQPDTGTDDPKKETGKGPKPLIEEEAPPLGPWGNRCVTSRRAGMKKPPEKDSSLNVRINMDLRADVALELHAVLQGDITIGLF